MKRHGWVGCGWLAVLGLVVGSTGCATRTVAGGTATVPMAATTSTVDPWAVPAVIDVAYLQRVMDRLDQSLGDALRELVAAKSVDPKVDQILRSIYSDSELPVAERDFQLHPGDLAEFRAVPGNPTSQVSKVLSASAVCVYFYARRHFDAVFAHAIPDQDTYGWLAIERGSPSALNPTGWRYRHDAGPQPTKDPCT